MFMYTQHTSDTHDASPTLTPAALCVLHNLSKCKSKESVRKPSTNCEDTSDTSVPCVTYETAFINIKEQLKMVHETTSKCKGDATYEELVEKAHCCDPENEPEKKESEISIQTQDVDIITFDNDTAVPALKRAEHIVKCAMDWYQHCEINVNIVSTDCKLPITNTPVNLGGSMPFEDIDFYVQSILPLIVQQTTISCEMEHRQNAYAKKRAMKKFKSNTIEWNVDNIMPYRLTTNKLMNTSEWISDDELVKHKKNSNCKCKPRTCTCYLNVENFLPNTPIIFETTTNFFPETWIVSFDKCQTFVLTFEDKEDYETALELLKCSEFKFSLEFKTDIISKPLNDMVNLMFHEKIFTSEKHMTDALSNFKLYTCTDLVPSLNDTEMSQVKCAMERHFVILKSDDESIKIKSSIICEKVMNSMKGIESFKPSGFKNRLPEYLSRLGLQKKRCSDGYYYYSIKFKTQDKFYTDEDLNRHAKRAC